MTRKIGTHTPIHTVTANTHNVYKLKVIRRIDHPNWYEKKKKKNQF